jgi:hypothetical protein
MPRGQRQNAQRWQAGRDAAAKIVHGESLLLSLSAWRGASGHEDGLAAHRQVIALK